MESSIIGRNLLLPHDYADNNHVKFLIALMDPGQPYSCTQWGNAPDGGSSQIVHDTEYDIFNMLNTGNQFPSYVWIDHEMRIYKKENGVSATQISTSIDEMLEACGELCLEDDCPTSGTGDVNADGLINVIEIVAIVGAILNSDGFTDECVQSSADYNSDGTINVIDIVAIVDLILGN